MKLYEAYDVEGIGYEKILNFQSWRIAKLNYINELDLKKLNFIECHHETDEIFILLQGKCDMYLLKELSPKTYEHISLEPQNIYRIPKGVYHAHALSKDAQILIVEEENTCDGNSHRIYLNAEEIKVLQSTK
ncbi:MAG: hypothetical protein K8Q99_01035 [Acholeplasmataceae bacterium]|nr:hypothetical protein [Acholeplasmataceae bacterium]